ncbi:putative tyrosinase [Geopyxis carbonaria]|nr:putative tyrosinase [Geopyxis carbonaria]
MHFLPILCALGLASSAIATPMPTAGEDDYSYGVSGGSSNSSNSKKCKPKNVRIRKEWRNMSGKEQKAYLDAELCLMKAPSKTGLPGVTSRFEDLQAMHQLQTNIIHGVAQFLPFHRLYVHIHEVLLREECGYKGAAPWWDETLDAGDFASSPLLTAKAFGSDGAANDDWCVQDGPFKDVTLHVGPGQTYTEHCLSRQINETASEFAYQSVVDKCHAKANFEEYWKCNIDNPHLAGHIGVGGVVKDVDTSPGDPLFYLHHNWIDRLWWKWQAEDPETRMYQLGGFTTPVKPVTGWVETTLDYVMDLYGIGPDTTVGDIMNIQGGFLCYDFDY